MNEYEKIINIVVENISAGKMTKEDAVTILTSLFSIAESNRIFINEDSKPWPSRIFINEDSKPWPLTTPVTYSDAPNSLPESLLKQATTLPYTLLKAMADAGYEWDAEKKELKKIESNPAWSEEDEKNCSGIIDEIAVNKSEAPESDYDTYDRFIDWLESLKDKVHPQPRREWSKEDKVMLDEVIDFFENGTVKFQHDLSLYASWLKSLRPQPHWKPSEEQMDALEHFVRSIGESGHASPYDANLKLVHSLFNDLKKLKS